MIIVEGSFDSYAYALNNLNMGLVDFIERDKFDGQYTIRHPKDMDVSIDDNHEIIHAWDELVSVLNKEFSVTVLTYSE